MISLLFYVLYILVLLIDFDFLYIYNVGFYFYLMYLCMLCIIVVLNWSIIIMYINIEVKFNLYSIIIGNLL